MVKIVWIVPISLPLMTKILGALKCTVIILINGGGGDNLSPVKIKLNERIMMMNIYIKRHNPKLIMPEQVAGSDWIDLRAAEDIWIPEGEFALIDLGVSIDMPYGYEAHVIPRSSLFKNFGLIQTNSMGLIDNSYCSDNDRWKFPAYCLQGRDFIDGRKGTMVHLNDRICQFRVVENQPSITFREVDSLSGVTRGGFGSTGVQ